MNVFFDLIANLLAFIYGVVPNYAIAIIGLTLVIMIVVTPLTLKGTRSMMVMQQLQPEMKKIQSRYKDDRQKLNEELLKFYKENDISPLGGCLPLLVQMPVFIVLYQVLRGLTRRISDMGFNMGWVTGQLGSGTSPSKPPSLDRNFDPAFLSHRSQMYQDLSNTNTMQAFGMDLAESASKALSQGFVHALPYLMLIVVVGITGVIQQRQIQGRNPQQQVNPQQQMIMKVMPIFLPVISFGLPAGLVLYFAVSNIYRVGQQWFISRSIYGIKGGGATTAAVSSGGGSGGGSTGGGFMAGLKQAFGGGAIDTTATEEKTAPSDAGAEPQKGASKPTRTGGGAAGGRAKKASSSSGRSTGKSTSSAQPPARASKSTSRGGAPSTSPKPAPKGNGASGAGAAPTLQPRARKNKKRS